LRLDGNKAEAWLSCQGHDKQSISVLDAQASVLSMRTLHAGCRIGFQMSFLLTHSASSPSHSATIQTSIFDKALPISRNQFVIIP
jgi:hypothetical protein